MRPSFTALAVTLMSSAFVRCLPQSQNEFNWNSIKYVYAFGDSYSFVQGTAGQANFSFIGDAFNLAFSPDELRSDRILPRNTSSNGSNWLEFLTGCFEGEPSNCAPHQLWDFAFAGADIDQTLLPVHHNFTVDLVGQVQQWANAVLVAWWIGINDTGDILGLNITDFEAFWKAEMASYLQAVELAYSGGLRGTHLFVNVPPEERAPHFLGSSRASAVQTRIQEFNAALARTAEQIATAHPDLRVLTFDAHAWFARVLDNAAAFGFHNTTGFCECSDASYFWFNDGHPTERVHRLLAQAVEAQLLGISL